MSFKIQVWAGEAAQQVNAFAARPDELCFIAETHVVQGALTHGLRYVCAHKLTKENQQTILKFKKSGKQTKDDILALASGLTWVSVPTST